MCFRMIGLGFDVDDLCLLVEVVLMSFGLLYLALMLVFVFGLVGDGGLWWLFCLVFWLRWWFGICVAVLAWYVLCWFGGYGADSVNSVVYSR